MGTGRTTCVRSVPTMTEILRTARTTGAVVLCQVGQVWMRFQGDCSSKCWCSPIGDERILCARFFAYFKNKECFFINIYLVVIHLKVSAILMWLPIYQFYQDQTVTSQLPTNSWLFENMSHIKQFKFIDRTLNNSSIQLNQYARDYL